MIYLYIKKNNNLQILAELAQERDFYQAQIQGNTALPLSPFMFISIIYDFCLSFYLLF
jgi:hypothetical protein